MNSPEDDIPLPSEPVLSEEETSRQLKRDYCRQFIEENERLKARIAKLEEGMRIVTANLTRKRQG